MLHQACTKLEELYTEMVDLRRDFHMYPELSFQEVETPKKIAAYLRKLGIEVQEGVGGRGIVATIYGKKQKSSGEPGKTVALRADFDALPIQDEKQVEYKSRVPGVMHACGHDIHTAALLGTAKIIKEYEHELSGTVVLIFQHAEELIPGGAISMVEDGCLDGVDVIYGAHVFSGLPLGVIGVQEGYMLAAGDEFQIEIQGKGGHGASPHESIDPVVIGSQLILNLQQVVSRRVDPLQPAVVTIGSFQSGATYNVIPDTAQILGTVRTFSEETRTSIEKEMQQIVQHTVEGAGATVQFTYRRGYPSVWNDPAETRRVEAIAKQLVGNERVIRVPPQMGGEDFAYYLQKIPGNFIGVGGGNSEINAIYPHHHPMFDVDERSMLQIGKLFLGLLAEHLVVSEDEGAVKTTS
ncbi:M20 metallopeptidase family protein [Brevibacillus laterosporus]|uniref:M20 metallopeptidase family protein n=1 Tax=Brevibacillus laterosporus TaxID=1465 RepID=UPI000E6C5537|nr:M20 family metallopeptidase [Brevibacillus laterosporus]AYB36911.1 amidohydrolase [Brevibacillus laterosporus]MBM7107310.1 putative hydrolase YxeP [Brevibacillus laterosporus]